VETRSAHGGGGDVRCDTWSRLATPLDTPAPDAAQSAPASDRPAGAVPIGSNPVPTATLEEASTDLGADSWQTFLHVTLPTIRSALFAGALLAFALSFDEVIVTIFTAGGVQTLPIWIFQRFRLANQVALVNVVGLVAILLSVLPVYIASRITQGEATGRT